MNPRNALWVALLMLGIAVPATASPDPGLGDLPVIEVPPARPGSGRMVILLSGDGGWSGLVRTIAAALAADGVGVVGLDSLKYFWTPRTPEETTRDVARIAEHYSKQWRADRLVLVGYSFGADVLPVVVNRLPRDLRRRLDGLTLIAPSPVANFEVHAGGWLGVHYPGLPILPELERLRGLPMACISGDDDDESVCPLLPAGLARVTVLAGGHHFGGNFDAVARLVLP